MQTLLPNIKRGGGGALKQATTTEDQLGRSLGGVGKYNNVPKYKDAIQSIEDCIEQARYNLEQVKLSMRDDGVELPIPEADSDREETQMNEPNSGSLIKRKNQMRFDNKTDSPL